MSASRSRRSPENRSHAEHRASADELSAFRCHRHALASAFAVSTAIATAFSSSLISFLKPCPLWCHRSNVLPYTGLPQCDEHVEEGSVQKELRSNPFVNAHFRG